MTFAFSTLGCPECTLPEAAELAKHFGVDGLELRVLANRLDLPTYLTEAFAGGWQGAREFLEACGIKVPVVGSSFSLVGYDSSSQDELLTYCRLAAALQVPYVRIFGGGEWGKTLDDEDLMLAAKTLHWWEEKRGSEGWNVDLLVETHGAFSASHYCVRLAKFMDGCMNVLWDAHHTWRMGHESPEDTWEILRHFIRHVHLKDSVSQPSGRETYTYVLPGHGEMPNTEVLRMLRADGFVGTISLEWEKQWHPELPKLADALSAARDAAWW